ncbi:hypothetical protein TNCV_1982571 [Trichonephila clavipes]|nr:hypothetical protein TNCV_1982571 [Trichonephila clavipes]
MSCDFEKKNCDPPVRCTNVSHPSEVGGKEFNVNRSSDCDVKMKVGVCEGRVKTGAMGAQRGEGVVTSSIVVNPHLSISVMVSPAGQGHVRRHRLSLHFYDPPAVE